ncbi:MAG: Abi family protein [Prevotellaceae bacterium]|jgi:abortive infection bacteriophage resistance protein|nr:Abi family protein [Prevotellaceae bacterium]
MNKPAYTIPDQIALLKQRGMIFRDEAQARDRLQNISYYRLKGYWWDMQSDTTLHLFYPSVCFEDVLERYDFDRKLRLILFGGIERIEIAVRTSLIYHLSLAYGGLWYLNPALFEIASKIKNGVSKTTHLHTLGELQKEFVRSQELFIKDHQRRCPGQPADAWKILEIASMGTLSKLYKSIKINLPEKGIIANKMGINSPHVFSGWMESIAYIRNIIAHHSRLWGRTMVKRPGMQLNNPQGAWFSQPLKQGQMDKPFSTISCMVYLCCFLNQPQDMKREIIDLINAYPRVPIYKYGFFNGWQAEPLWK